MKRLFYCTFLVLLLSSHDMYLKLDEFKLKPWSEAIIQLFNGTFDRSDNVITRDRMLDVSLVGNGTRTSVDTTLWYEKDSITYLQFSTEGPGTWIAGVSTKARSFAQSPKAFNNYLKHDGVLDILESRTQQGTLQDSAVERYSKHVKTIFQVGKQLTDDYKTELGYPIEFIPIENPYSVHAGHDLTFKLLFDQKPLANQLVYAGYKAIAHEHSHTHDNGESHSHDHDDDHHHDEMLQLRTNERGLVKVPISEAGTWYLRTIHLVEVAEEGLTHESNWATITFAISGGDHSHAHDHHHEDEEHSHGEGIPAYIYWILSVVAIAGLYFWFNRKK